MASEALDTLAEQLALADVLLAGRESMLAPQDLPGRYGRVVRAIDHLLDAVVCEAVVGGGWAVWRHGHISRVTQDLDIVLPAASIEQFLRAASVSGFEVLPQVPGRWPKIRHKETNVRVDILPEGERPGVPPDFAPTTIPSPSKLGAAGTKLQYMDLPALVELKLAAGRLKDRADIVELIRANREDLDGLREHLAEVHVTYLQEFDRLVEQAKKDVDR